MAQEIIMPKTGMAMEEGTIMEWFVKKGDYVSKGDILAELETDKSTMEYESDYEGTVLELVYPAGSIVKVTLPIAWLGTPGEKIPQTETSKDDRTVSSEPLKDTPLKVEIIQDGPKCKTKATPAARKLADDKKFDISTIKATGSHQEVKKIDVLDALQNSVKVTPLASRMANGEGIDLNGVQGSGYRGKIYSKDLSHKQHTSLQYVSRESTSLPLNKIKKITGERMVYSHSTIPMVSEHAKANITDLLSIREQINKNSEIHVSINDLILFATAKLLPKYPLINSTLNGDSITLHGQINLGMAVATEKGLLVAVIRDADMMSLSHLSNQASILAQKGRDGVLKPDELSGSTFTVSNVGKYGIISFNPIINPPEAAILGVCAIEDVPMIKDGNLVSIKKIGLSLTFDHRIIDGAEAAQFMQALIHMLEHPFTFLI